MINQVGMNFAGMKIGFSASKPRIEMPIDAAKVAILEADPLFKHGGASPTRVVQQYEKAKRREEHRKAVAAKRAPVAPSADQLAELARAKASRDAAATTRNRELAVQPRPVTTRPTATSASRPGTWQDGLLGVSGSLNGTLATAIANLRAHATAQIGKTPGAFNGDATPEGFLKHAVPLLTAFATSSQPNANGVGGLVTLARILGQGENGKEALDATLKQLEAEARKLQPKK